MIIELIRKSIRDDFVGRTVAPAINLVQYLLHYHYDYIYMGVRVYILKI